MMDKIHLYTKKGIIFVFTPLIKLFIWLHISPNIISFLGFLANFIAAGPVGLGSLQWGGLLILLGGLFDLLDGHIARGQNRVTRFGGLLDSTLDRYSELFLFLGISFFFIRIQEMAGLIAVFFTISGSLMVSYVRARAEGLGIPCSIGLIQRPERVVLLAVSCFLPFPGITYVIYFLAITTNYTVLQRIYHVYKHDEQKPTPS